MLHFVHILHLVDLKTSLILLGHWDISTSCWFPGQFSDPLHIIISFSVLFIILCFLFFFIPESFIEKLRIISANRCFIRGKVGIESHLKDSFSFLWMAYQKRFRKHIPSDNFNLFKSLRPLKVLVPKLCVLLCKASWVALEERDTEEKEKRSRPSPSNLQRHYLRNELSSAWVVLSCEFLLLVFFSPFFIIINSPILSMPLFCKLKCFLKSL